MCLLPLADPKQRLGRVNIFTKKLWSFLNSLVGTASIGSMSNSESVRSNTVVQTAIGAARAHRLGKANATEQQPLSYVNYLDPSLGSLASGDWRYLAHYYGNNLERLREVKAKMDPNMVFNRPQGIPPAGMQPSASSSSLPDRIVTGFRVRVSKSQAPLS